MPIDPMIARGYPVNAAQMLFEGQRDRSRNALIDVTTQQRQQELDDDAEWDKADAAGDIETMLRIDPEATKLILAHRQQQAMAGLGDISVTAKPMEEPASVPTDPVLRQQGGYSYLFGDKGVIPGSVQQPQRAPIGGGGGQVDGFDRYQSMTEEQRALYDQYRGRGGSAGESQFETDGNGVAYNPSKATDGERTAVGYYDRIVSARQSIEAPGMANYVPSMGSFMAFASLLDDETGVVGATVANKVLNDVDREYMGQALDLILAKMRKESGATIKGGEFRKEYINLFPMPNDPPKVLADKKIKRQLAENQLRKAAGKAAGPIATDALQSPEVQQAIEVNKARRESESKGLTAAEKAELEALRKKRGKSR